MPSSNIPCVDDGRVGNGIIYAIKHGLQWKDAPDEYCPHKTLYNRFVRWRRIGVFNKIFTELENKIPFDGSLMIESTHQAHRTAASPLKKGILHILQINKRRTDPDSISFVTGMGLLSCFCWLKDRSATTRGIILHISSSITVCFWGTEAMMQRGCVNL